MVFSFISWLVDKIGLLRTPLQKIVTGGTLLAFAFCISGVLELFLEKTYPHPPGSDTARLAFHNSIDDCKLDIEIEGLPDLIVNRE